MSGQQLGGGGKYIENTSPEIDFQSPFEDSKKKILWIKKCNTISCIEAVFCKESKEVQCYLTKAMTQLKIFFSYPQES